MTDTLQTVSYLDKGEWNKPLCLIDEAMDVMRSIKAERDAALERNKYLEHDRDLEKKMRKDSDDLATDLAERVKVLEAERDRFERNRDMWKGQCERQAKSLLFLHKAISDHNKECERQCDGRKEMGGSHCPMKGYKRKCSDCPKDGILHFDAAIDAASMAGKGTTE